MFRKGHRFHHEILSGRSPAIDCQRKTKELSGMHGTRKTLKDIATRLNLDLEVLTSA